MLFEEIYRKKKLGKANLPDIGKRDLLEISRGTNIEIQGQQGNLMKKCEKFRSKLRYEMNQG